MLVYNYYFFQFTIFVSVFVNYNNLSIHTSECACMCACAGVVATAVSVSVPLFSLSCCPAPHTAVPPFSPTRGPPHLLAWLTAQGAWGRCEHEEERDDSADVHTERTLFSSHPTFCSLKTANCHWHSPLTSFSVTVFSYLQTLQRQKRLP